MKVGGRGGDVIEKIGHWYLNWKIVQKKQRGERDEEARRSSKKLEEKEGEREKERQRERVDGRNVEKLHPAHCIEIQEKERLRQKRDDGAEGWRRKERSRMAGRRVAKGARAARRVSGVVGTPKIASRYDDARSGPILDFSQFASLKAAEQ